MFCRLIFQVSELVIGTKRFESIYKARETGKEKDGMSERTIKEVLCRLLVCNFARLSILGTRMMDTCQTALDVLNKSNPVLAGNSSLSFQTIMDSSVINSSFEFGVKKVLNFETTDRLKKRMDPKHVSSKVSLDRTRNLKESREYISASAILGDLDDFKKMANGQRSRIPIVIEQESYMNASIRGMKYTAGVQAAWNVAASRLRKEMWGLVSGPTGLMGGVMHELLESVNYTLGSDYEVFIALELVPSPNSSIETLLSSGRRITFRVVVGLGRVSRSLDLTDAIFLASGKIFF
jgi:hypothetical protein